MQYGWSMDERDWAKLPADVVNGKSWRYVPFDIGEEKSVPDDPGVYAICAFPPGRNRPKKAPKNDLFGVLYTTLYVGKAVKQTLRTRFGQHCNDPKDEIRECKEFFGNLEFWFCRFDSERISEIEEFLIDCFGPSANLIRGGSSANKKGTISAKTLSAIKADSQRR